MQRPYLNLGCGRVILPAPKPAHYAILPDALTDYALWTNVDRNLVPGVDLTFDLFRYPWPLRSNGYDGALIAHVAEHIPHGIKVRDSAPEWFEPDFVWGSRAAELAELQDGWWAFFAELYRVLTPGAVAHVLSPYAWSAGAMTDPSHTRYLTEHTFTHSMQPDASSPFAYQTGGIHFELAEPPRFGLTGLHDLTGVTQQQFYGLMQTQINVVSEIYQPLRVVKA